MRKLKLQVQISVDGYIAGTGGEMDWVTVEWGDGLKTYVSELTESADCIVLGRKLAEGFIPHWKNVAADPDNPERAAGETFTGMPKVVFSQTLDVSTWPNTTLATGHLADEVDALKRQDGKDIIAYGGAGFVSSLIAHRLIDEFHLFINPVALGAGMPIFAGLPDTQKFTLEMSKAFACGIVLAKYLKAA